MPGIDFSVKDMIFCAIIRKQVGPYISRIAMT